MAAGNDSAQASGAQHGKPAARDDGAQSSGPQETKAGGLFDSAKAVLATLVSIGHTRLKLLSVEVQEELARLAELLLWGIAAVLFAALGLFLATLAILMALWSTHPLLAVSTFAGLYLAIAAVASLVLRHKLRSSPRLLAATLSELDKDREQLSGHR